MTNRENVEGSIGESFRIYLEELRRTSVSVAGSWM